MCELVSAFICKGAQRCVLPGDIWRLSEKPGGNLETASKTWSLQAKSGDLASMVWVCESRKVHI